MAAPQAAIRVLRQRTVSVIATRETVLVTVAKLSVSIENVYVPAPSTVPRHQPQRILTRLSGSIEKAGIEPAFDTQQ
jgi:hypothetical protein